MILLANNTSYFVEFGGLPKYRNKVLIIARRRDGECLIIPKRGIARTFKKMLAEEPEQKAIDRMMRIAGSEGYRWQFRYKPHQMPEVTA